MKNAIILFLLGVFACGAASADFPENLFRGLVFADSNFEQALELFAEARYADLSAVCNGRLTISAGIAIQINDVIGATSMLFTPYGGSKISVYTGTRWKLMNFTEQSVAVPSVAGGINYDVFGYDNAGTFNIELSAAWASDSTRTDALTTQDGVKVKSGASTRRYLGTFRTYAFGNTRDTNQHRFVWNECNRLQRSIVMDTGAGANSYNGSYVQFNFDPSNQISMVQGDTSLVQIDGVTEKSGYAGNSSLGFTVNGVGTPDAANEHRDSSFMRGPIALSVSLDAGYNYIALVQGTASGGTAYFNFFQVAGWLVD